MSTSLVSSFLMSWFSVGAGKSALLVQSLIENCIQPRCLLSPMDADYCARLIRTLHVRGTPGFYTLMCYNKVRMYPPP